MNDPRDYVDEEGTLHEFRDGDEILTEGWEEIYGEGDPNDTGEYYDEWMPEFTGAE